MFGYLRLFSILALLVITVLAVVAGISFRTLAEDELTRLMERSSAGLAQGYSGNIWQSYSKVMMPLLGADPASLKNNPDVLQFAQGTAYYFQKLPLLRANIYSESGMLLMTVNGADAVTSPKLADNVDNEWLALNLKNKKMATNVKHHNFAEKDYVLIQTLTAISAEAGLPAQAMLEIIYDVTPSWQKLMHVQYYGTGGFIAVFLTFLCMLFLVSRKAEMIIARQHEANLELTAAAAAAQAENRDKSQFLANVSHELRTPLNAIIGFSEIIKNEAISQVDSKKHQDYVSDIYSSGVHLLSLINDILDYSKAEAGKLELEVSEVNASKMIQNCIRLVQPRAESGDVRLVEALPKEQFILLTDNKKFKQILLNLLSNAVKFTPPGGDVRITGWRDVNDDSCTFEVRDSGIGIAPKDIARAMSPFGQVDSALNRKYEGTGLGLPLTKKFVELMGGKFTIESTLNVGTTITFTLPREMQEREGVIIKQVS